MGAIDRKKIKQGEVMGKHSKGPDQEGKEK